MDQDGRDDDGFRDGRGELLSDIELVTRLRAEVPPGMLWAITEREIARCAIRILHGCILERRINGKLAALKRPVKLTDVELDQLREHDDERGDMVNEAVARGLRQFRDHGIHGNRWHPGLASVRTYAINACFRELPNQVRGWRAHHSERGRRPDLDLTEFESMGLLERLHPREDIGYAQQRSAELDEVLSILPGELAAAAWLRRQHDLTWAECAHYLGISPRVLEGQLRRFRQNHSRDEENPS
jgi:DNA-directed RNA polymerase specialized sigma24 family protein